MLPIYICEDEEAIRNAERAWLEKKILIEGLDMEIALCTESPKELLKHLSGEQKRGIYFLDVELKGSSMDGFQLGQEIRKIDARGFLVYVTAFQDLAFETFRYHLEALDYICKKNPEKMYEGLSHCLKVIEERVSREQGEQQEYFTVKTLDVVRHIPLKEILYFATAGRTHRIQELEEKLGQQFIRIHRAYLVRTDEIAQVNLKTKEVVLKNKERCPFSRNMKQKLLERMAGQPL